MQNYICHAARKKSIFNKYAFEYGAYLPHRNKNEQWPSSHEADCGQTDAYENITFLAVGNK